MLFLSGDLFGYAEQWQEGYSSNTKQAFFENFWNAS